MNLRKKLELCCDAQHLMPDVRCDKCRYWEFENKWEDKYTDPNEPQGIMAVCNGFNPDIHFTYEDEFCSRFQSKGHLNEDQSTQS